MTRLLLAALLPVSVWVSGTAPALAQSNAVPVRNGSGETIAAIRFNGGESRLRRELPPGAEARITYSTGCRADIQLVFASGRTEDHPGVDTCGGGGIVAGQGGTAGAQQAPPPRTAAAGAPPTSAGAKPAAANPLAAKAPPPEIPPWTGKSITKRFGGLD